MTSPGTQSALSRWLLAPSIRIKILGIVALATLLPGSILTLELRSSLATQLSHQLEKTTLVRARSLASQLERPLAVEDRIQLHIQLRKALSVDSDLDYVIVENAQGVALAHTFPKGIPGDLTRLPPLPLADVGAVRVLRDRAELIFEATAPALGGRRVRVGSRDRAIRRELRSLTWRAAVVQSLAALLALGAALFLTHVLVSPLEDLLRAVLRIDAGDFEHRAPVAADAEFRRLSLAFNRMVQGLKRERERVEHKEAARVGLINRVVACQEDERRRIARDLHDELGQSLSALSLAIHSLTKEEPAEKRKGVEDRISELFGQVRRLAWDLRPPILDDLGLGSTLEHHAAQVSRQAGIPIDCQLVPPTLPRFAPEIEITLYRVAQEALTNIARHADASRASVVVIARPQSITLLVEDDGVGFDLPALRAATEPGCLGILGMEERVTLLGGTLDLESSPGADTTTVRVIVPLGPAPDSG